MNDPVINVKKGAKWTWMGLLATLASLASYGGLKITGIAPWPEEHDDKVLTGMLLAFGGIFEAVRNARKHGGLKKPSKPKTYFCIAGAVLLMAIGAAGCVTEREQLFDADGNPVLDANGDPVYIEVERPRLSPSAIAARVVQGLQTQANSAEELMNIWITQPGNLEEKLATLNQVRSSMVILGNQVQFLLGLLEDFGVILTASDQADVNTALARFDDVRQQLASFGARVDALVSAEGAEGGIPDEAVAAVNRQQAVTLSQLESILAAYGVYSVPLTAAEVLDVEIVLDPGAAGSAGDASGG